MEPPAGLSPRRLVRGSIGVAVSAAFVAVAVFTTPTPGREGGTLARGQDSPSSLRMSPRSARGRRDRPTRSARWWIPRSRPGPIRARRLPLHRGRGCPRRGCCRVTFVDGDPYRVARGGRGHGVLDQAHGRAAGQLDSLGVRHQDERRCHRLHRRRPRAGDDVLVSGVGDHDLGNGGRVRHRLGHDLGGAAEAPSVVAAATSTTVDCPGPTAGARPATGSSARRRTRSNGP